MQTKIVRADQASALTHAVDVLRHGGLVAFPTDTVYGLAAMPVEEAFIDRLYIVKGRNHTKAIAVLLGDKADLAKVSSGPNTLAEQLAASFWPGPITLIVPRHPSLPAVLSKDETIGVRIPDHPVALEFLKLTGPLAVTSANLSGKPSARTAKDVLDQLSGRVHLVIDGGRTPGGVPSTVVDCTAQKPEILRAGPISLAKINAAVSQA